MKKFILIGVVIIVILGGAAFWFFNRGCDTSKIDTSGIILFYGSGCPHCAEVEDYLKTNNVKDKVQFGEKEVFYNKCNTKLLEELAPKCGFSLETLGVPLLWNGASSTCFGGDQDIINFFKEKIGG
jgi:hypothetical protein